MWQKQWRSDHCSLGMDHLYLTIANARKNYLPLYQKSPKKWDCLAWATNPSLRLFATFCENPLKDPTWVMGISLWLTVGLWQKRKIPIYHIDVQNCYCMDGWMDRLMDGWTYLASLNLSSFNQSVPSLVPFAMWEKGFMATSHVVYYGTAVCGLFLSSYWFQEA